MMQAPRFDRYANQGVYVCISVYMCASSGLRVYLCVSESVWVFLHVSECFWALKSYSGLLNTLCLKEKIYNKKS